MNCVTDKNDFASGVLIRAVQIDNENERIASGPGLVTRNFQVDLIFNSLKIYDNKFLQIYDLGLRFDEKDIIKTTRIGITKARELKWRWYLKNSRSISKRAKGDKNPSKKTLKNSYFKMINENLAP